MSEAKLATLPAGKSLLSDAWRQLRRDRPAMLALVVLALMALLAVITPLLPLQAPDQDHTDLVYAGPTASPLWLSLIHI